MLPAMKHMRGKVITVCGPVDPVALGKVMMHEHLYVNLFNKVDGEIQLAERDLIFKEGIPSIRKCNEYGCHAFCAQQEDKVFRYDNMPPPPWLYMFTETLPSFRRLGLTAQEEETMMVKNPQRILPVQ